MTTLYDVVAINIRTGAERVLERDRTLADAEAFVKFAVIRRGVDTEFCVTKSALASL